MAGGAEVGVLVQEVELQTLLGHPPATLLTSDLVLPCVCSRVRDQGALVRKPVTTFVAGEGFLASMPSHMGFQDSFEI